MLSVMRSIALDPEQPGMARLAAARYIQDRAWVKPPPTPLSDGEAFEIDADTIRRRVEDAYRETAQMVGQVTEKDSKAGNAFFGEQAY
jgi:hypothetical protein